MKNYKNILLLFSFSIILLVGCKKDDIELVNEEDFNIGLFNLDAIQTPDAMAQSSDPHAQAANAQILALSSFKFYQAFFLFPAGAEKSNTPITGRRAGEYTVYKWADGDGGEIAYQYQKVGDEMLYEVFVKENGLGYRKCIGGKQIIAGKYGEMYIYEKGFNSTTLVDVIYTWDYKEGISKSSMKITEDNMLLELIFRDDKSGELTLKENGVLQSNWTWNATGAGSWNEYNTDGSVSDQGDWG